MEKTPEGYAPAPGFLEAQMATMPELSDPAMPAYDIGEYDPLLDSANMTPDDWFKIAKDIAARYDHYDGFVVLHGTDTMAYTASALPFMLQGLQKPVVLSGSQIPLCEVRNDARENIITSLMIASGFAIPEVCLYFSNRLYRGCRTVKVNAYGFDAFASPNYPPLAKVGTHITANWDLILPPPRRETILEARRFNKPLVGSLRLFPGITAEVVHNMLQAPLQGLVLEAYGVGNGPHRDDHFMATLKEATDRGVIIVDCTQCLRGSVDLSNYATGAAMARAGIISGYDMTTEAALAKMFYLFSEGIAVEEVKKLLQTDLRGELTRV